MISTLSEKILLTVRRRDIDRPVRAAQDELADFGICPRLVRELALQERFRCLCCGVCDSPRRKRCGVITFEIHVHD